MNKKHIEECMKPHTMLHSLFGLGLGLLLGALLQLSGNTGIFLGIIVMIIAFIGDYIMGSKKK